MNVYYYYFIVPIKDNDIEVIDDSSISHIRLNKKFDSLHEHMDKNSVYILLKGIDEASCSVNDQLLDMFIKNRNKADTSVQDLFAAILQSFEFSCNSYKKYIAISQYPLLVLRTKDKHIHIIKPQSPTDIFNHCFLHFYQFLKIKKLQKEEDKINTLIKLSNSNYSPGIHPSARYVTCCMNNILIHMSSRKIFILKHNCNRSKIHSNVQFDSNLFNTISSLLE